MLTTAQPLLHLYPWGPFLRLLEKLVVCFDKERVRSWIGSADDVHAGQFYLEGSDDFGASFGKTTSVSGPGVASMPELAPPLGKIVSISLGLTPPSEKMEQYSITISSFQKVRCRPQF